MREALFSILGDVSGLRVLDLFAGSGALGIEALSRGASEAVFVDNSVHATRTVKANLEALGLEAGVHRADALRFVRRTAGEGRYDVVFVDPPYDQAGRLGSRLSEQLPAILSDDARIVTESDKRAPLLLSFDLARERVYGDTRVAVYRHG